MITKFVPKMFHKWGIEPWGTAKPKQEMLNILSCTTYNFLLWNKATLTDLDLVYFLILLRFFRMFANSRWINFLEPLILTIFFTKMIRTFLKIFLSFSMLKYRFTIRQITANHYCHLIKYLFGRNFVTVYIFYNTLTFRNESCILIKNALFILMPKWFKRYYFSIMF